MAVCVSGGANSCRMECELLPLLPIYWKMGTSLSLAYSVQNEIQYFTTLFLLVIIILYCCYILALSVVVDLSPFLS